MSVPALLVAITLAATPPSLADRPRVDPDAMREAAGGARTIDRYASARAYLHYLEARLAEHDGRLADALAALKLATVYDDEAAELRVALGRVLGRLHELDKAEAEARRAIALDPRAAPAQLLLGQLLAAQKRPGEAIVALEKTLELAPSDREAHLLLVRLHLLGGELARAERAALRMGKAHPNDGEPLRIVGRAAFEAGDAETGERLLRQAATVDPWDFPTRLELAGRAERSGRAPQAEADYEAVLRRDPEQPEALIGAARLALQRGDGSSARAYLSQLLGSAGPDRDARLRAALGWLAEQYPEEALALLKEAASIDARDKRIPYYRGLVLEEQRRWLEAATAYDEVPAELTELRPRALARAAYCLSKAGKGALAVGRLEAAFAAAEGRREALEDVVGFVPDVFRRAGRSAEGVALIEAGRPERTRPEVATALSRALVDAGRPAEAIALYERALAIAPLDPRLVFGLATVLEQQGEVDRSVELARRMLAVDPEDPSALNFVGYVLAEHDRALPEARRLVERALELRPDEPAYLDSLGWILVKQGDPKAGLALLEKASAKLPEDPEILEHVGEALRRLGRTAEARAAFERALRALAQDPNERLRKRIEGRLPR